MRRSSPLVVNAWALCFLLGIGEGTAARSAEETSSLTVTRPVPHEVFQREGYIPNQAHAHSTSKEALGFASVPVSGRVTGPASGTWELRWQGVDHAADEPAPWQPFEVERKEEVFTGKVRIPAGGWYRLEIRLQKEGAEVGHAIVEPFGVGEIFLIAGQSYAAGANDALLRITDPQLRISAFDVKSGHWQVAHDPQPNVGDGGTIWPPMANALVPMIQVPIGLVNVAAGGTSSRQWLPGTPLYEQLAIAGKSIGGFRFVLWQQGESDVIEHVDTATYVANLTKIRSALAKEWNRNVPWLLAKSTLHPTVYRDPEGEKRIRTAIDELCKLPGFRPGPDTDVLAGSNRGGPQTRRHFTAEGQENAGRLWFATLWNELSLANIDADGEATASSVPLTVRQTPAGIRYGILDVEDRNPAPTVIVLGLGIEKMTAKQSLMEVGQLLHPKGYVVLVLDPPCHAVDVRPGEPAELNGWPYRIKQGEDIVEDFLKRTSAILDHLVQEKRIDPKRIAACGTSRGGFLALHLAAADDRIQLAVGFAPVTDLSKLSEFNDLHDNPLVKHLSLGNRAAALVNKRTLVFIGNNDVRVGTDAAISLCRAIAQAATKREPVISADVSLEVRPSQGHATPAGAHAEAASWIESHFRSPSRP